MFCISHAKMNFNTYLISDQMVITLKSSSNTITIKFDYKKRAIFCPILTCFSNDSHKWLDATDIAYFDLKKSVND